MITDHYFQQEQLRKNPRPGICACGVHETQHNTDAAEAIRNSVTRENYLYGKLSNHVTLNFGPGRILNLSLEQAAALADEIQKQVARKR